MLLKLDGKTEVEISSARISFLGWALGLSTLAALGFTSLSAAHAGWGGYTNQAKSPQFRPWSRTQQQPAGRWRPQHIRYTRPVINAGGTRRPFTASPGIRTHTPLFAGEGRNVRKAVAVTRAQDLGVRFRPEGRQPAYAWNQQNGDGNADRYQVRLHSQFRPTRAGRKATYEEIQYARGSRQRSYSPGMSYLVPAPPTYGSVGNWGTW